MKRIAIIGAGGCAREVAWLLRDISANAHDSHSQYSVAGYLVSDVNRPGRYDSPVLGDFSWLESHNVDGLALGIGTPGLRLRLSAELEQRFPHLEWPALIHPSVKFDPESVDFGEGAIVCANSIVTLNVQIKPFSFVGLSCTVSHEAVIGRGCALNPSVNISGGVTLGNGVLVGTGAQVLQYLRVGDGASIGAGAVVTKNVEANTTVAGVPARLLHTTASPDEVAVSGTLEVRSHNGSH